MSLIWRCAAKAAKESMIGRRRIEDVLAEIGWEIDVRADKPDEDMTARELTIWVQRSAIQKKDVYEMEQR
jgi:hypothetical protein